MLISAWIMSIILCVNVIIWVSVREAIVLTEIFTKLTVTIFKKRKNHNNTKY